MFEMANPKRSLNLLIVMNILSLGSTFTTTTPLRRISQLSKRRTHQFQFYATQVEKNSQPFYYQEKGHKIPENTKGVEDEKKKKSKKSPPTPLKPADPSEFPEWSYENRDFFRFEILYQSKKSMARVGRIHTPHGVIDTPGFVPVATNGALKGVDFADIDNFDDESKNLVFANTYHLLLQPGTEIIKNAGGIHKFTRREEGGPFITDSGGFQVFSLAYGSVQEELSSKGELKRSSNRKKQSDEKNKSNSHMDGKDAVKVTEDGVIFRSYRDGSKFLLTPETTIQAQKDIGADIIIPLDELPPYHISENTLAESVDRSHRWEARSLKEHLKNVNNQAMYCVVHGGLDRVQRQKSLEYLTSLPFDGYAIGGSLGSNRAELHDLLEWMMPKFNDLGKEKSEKPRHLLGKKSYKQLFIFVKKSPILITSFT